VSTNVLLHLDWNVRMSLEEHICIEHVSEEHHVPINSLTYYVPDNLKSIVFLINIELHYSIVKPMTKQEIQRKFVWKTKELERTLYKLAP